MAIELEQYVTLAPHHLIMQKFHNLLSPLFVTPLFSARTTSKSYHILDFPFYATVDNYFISLFIHPSPKIKPSF